MDLALLVVAANRINQNRKPAEHLAILDLMEVPQGNSWLSPNRPSR